MFAVDDFEREVATLTEKGASIVLKAIMPGGRTIAYVDLNVGGLVVELVQKLITLIVWWWDNGVSVLQVVNKPFMLTSSESERN
jgi:hypothetical protein